MPTRGVWRHPLSGKLKILGLLRSFLVQPTIRLAFSNCYASLHSVVLGNFFYFPSQDSNAIFADSAGKIIHTAPNIGPAAAAPAGPAPMALCVCILLVKKDAWLVVPQSKHFLSQCHTFCSYFHLELPPCGRFY